MTELKTIVEEPWRAEHLAGTLSCPDGDPARGPAALIIAGSGPTPRDGPFGLYRDIAGTLARSGIRALRYDKRGIGQSEALVPREDDLTFEHFVADAALAADNLAQRPDVSSVYIIGHSEGALIATLVAARMKLAGIALLAGIGRTLDVVIREQLLAHQIPPDQEHLRKQALVILKKLAGGKQVDNVPELQYALFRPSVQPFLLSAFAIDPAASLAALKRFPVLLVRGKCDIQVSAEDLQLLAEASPDARVVSIPRANHIFKPAPEDLSDRQAQLDSYAAPVPFVPELMRALVSFVRGTNF
jgi:alpha-beta hydrolase superfamily lysophospholipase